MGLRKDLKVLSVKESAARKGSVAVRICRSCHPFSETKMSQTKGMTHVSDSIHLKVIRPLSMVVG